MNDRRFIELLNLYLDHQIDPAEAGELESEVMRNPARRRIYDQYCRLQRGCCLLGERERSAAPASAVFARSLRSAERKIAAPRRLWWVSAYSGAVAASAMAACVAVIVVVRNQTPAGPQNDSLQIAATPQSPAIDVAAAGSVAAPVAVDPAARPMLASFSAHPMLTVSDFSAARNAREAEIAANDREVREWMQRVEQSSVHPVVVDDRAFETRPTLHQDNRVFRSRHDLQATAEFTAYQFQR